MAVTWLRSTLLLGLGALTLTTCQSPTAVLLPDPEVRRSTEGCWPISAECQDRPFDKTEENRVTTVVLRINHEADPKCARIQDHLMLALADEPKRIKFWSDGPDNYDPQFFRGDQHNLDGFNAVTHFTARAFEGTDNTILMKTAIHEGAHAIGEGQDSEADRLAEVCLGDTSP